MTSFFTAWQFLTVLPAAGNGNLAAAVRYSPYVGFGLGFILAGSDWALGFVLDPMPRAAVIVTLLAILTGAVHLDGVADTADGVLATRSPEDRLNIMKDPRVGGFAVVAVVLVLLLKTSALSEISVDRAAILIAVPTLSRWSIVWQGAIWPPARTGGFGSVWQAGTTPVAIAVSTLPVLLVVALSWPRGMGLVIATVVVGGMLGALAKSRIGGLTGDIFGATVEVTEAVTLLVAAAWTL